MKSKKKCSDLLLTVMVNAFNCHIFYLPFAKLLYETLSVNEQFSVH